MSLIATVAALSSPSSRLIRLLGMREQGGPRGTAAPAGVEGARGEPPDGAPRRARLFSEDLSIALVPKSHLKSAPRAPTPR